MTQDQDTDKRRDKVIQRLKASGCEPRKCDQILHLIDAMMTGRAPLAQVLVAAKEVCKVCDLRGTHQHIDNALACLAGEVMQYHKPSLDDDSGPARRKQSDSACWNPIEETLV